jgi:putative ABC transport system permease protein
MFRNYLTIALRNFRRQKGFALINILGLAIGLASATVIFLYIFDETGFDRFHPQSDHLYVLGTHGKFNGEEDYFPAAPGAWPKAMQENYPEVTEASQTFYVGYPASFRDPNSDKIILTESELWVDANFPRVFHFPLIQGDPATVFAQPNSMVLSASAARRFFGDDNPIGKTLEVKHNYVTRNQYVPLKITGVMQDYPANSHLQSEYLINMGMLRSLMVTDSTSWFNNWGNRNGWFGTYVRTSKPLDAGKTATRFNTIVQANLPKDPQNSIEPYIVPLGDLHFNDKMRSTRLSSGDRKYIYIFGSIGLLIVLIASINYMNLATARAFRRAKEIGLRKVVGSNRPQLIVQFMTESLLTAILALLLAIILVIALLPLFNEMSAKSFSITNLMQWRVIGSLLGMTLLVALLSGSYPALYLSGFKPIAVLKNTRFTGRSSEILRKGLVVLQYTITLALIICTGVMMKQMDLIRNTTLNRSGDQMLSIRYGDGLGEVTLDHYRAFKRLVQQDPELTQVTVANHLPRQDFFGPIDAEVTFPELGGEPRKWFTLEGDFDFPQTFGLEVLAGRSFDATNPADSNAFLINESGVKALALTSDKVVGMTVNAGSPYEGYGSPRVTGKIIGIVKDFNYRSVHQPVAPLLVTARPHPGDQIIYVKLPAGKMPEKIASLERKWKEVLPAGLGFDHWFISEEFGRMYEAEMRMAGLFKVFSGLAILIACLGLFGLSSYLSERRTKEIGIRKVMGASVPQILQLLFATFMKLLVIACVVAIPLAWFTMRRWLEDFSYRTPLDWGIFLLGVVLVLMLTVLTVSYETLRAARANPINSLRYE